ncbi:hypothetical protein FOXB_08851 [Fusarium oxysporum f. sp. conglutinans Fo5176]
MWDH